MSINEKMTAIADETRELVGSTGKMGLDAIATNLNEANGEVGEQTDLIAQISSALEGKAGGSGGSVSYDTCTVNISAIGLTIFGIAYVTVDENGEVKSILNKVSASSYNLTCLCNSMIAVHVSTLPFSDVTAVNELGWICTDHCRVFEITAPKDGIATITMQVAGDGGAD